MALGQGQGGGLMAWPDRPELGQLTWGEMTAMHPDSPLVGGRGAPSGGVDADYKYRRVAIASPASAQPVAGTARHFSELANFRHSPLPWVLMAAIAYLGLVHLHVAGGVGPYSARASVGK